MAKFRIARYESGGSSIGITQWLAPSARIAQRRRISNPPSVRLAARPSRTLQCQNGRGSRAARRPITVLFCDIVGSVSLANSLDPEDMMQVLDVFRACCDDIIARHNGYIARYLGDGVLACFGYPSADEEEASRAVRAALALQAAMGSLSPPTTAVSFICWTGCAG